MNSFQGEGIPHQSVIGKIGQMPILLEPKGNFEKLRTAFLKISTPHNKNTPISETRLYKFCQSLK